MRRARLAGLKPLGLLDEAFVDDGLPCSRREVFEKVVMDAAADEELNKKGCPSLNVIDGEDGAVDSSAVGSVRNEGGQGCGEYTNATS